MFFIFDTETIGLPDRPNFYEYFHPSLVEKYNSCRMIQIAYILADKNKEEKSRKVYYIKPDNFEIKNSHIHGITQEMALKEGKNLKDVLIELFQVIKDAEFLVAHNVGFDHNILVSEFYRAGLPEMAKEIYGKSLRCTKVEGKRKFNLDKSPKLSELYPLCTGKKWIQKHDAMDDTEKCFDCFRAV